MNYYFVIACEHETLGECFFANPKRTPDTVTPWLDKAWMYAHANPTGVSLLSSSKLDKVRSLGFTNVRLVRIELREISGNTAPESLPTRSVTV